MTDIQENAKILADYNERIRIKDAMPLRMLFCY